MNRLPLDASLRGAYCARVDGVFLDDMRFTIKGVSYFGMETDILVPHGLWGGDASTTLAEIAQLLTTHHFNLVRIPLAVSAVLENAQVDRYKMGNEKALLDAFTDRELRYLDVLDYVVQEFAKHKLLVLLDAHVLVPGGPITPLWYDQPSRRDWVQRAWAILADRYKDVWNVIGADVKNEPHGEATWGSGDRATDWRLAATELLESILSICPRWLIFIEGVQFSRHSSQADVQSKLPCFWGENLEGAEKFPIELSVPERLVYSPHVYGPDVADQSYFHDPQFPKNMPSVWDAHFGFVQRKQIGPVVVGEWGGKYRNEADREWQNEFAKYLEAQSIDAIYWCVNPNSGDTEGLLGDDWRTPNVEKLRLLSVFRGSSVKL